MHQRYNKWETEHILNSLGQIECLWEVSFGDLVLAPEGGVIAWALIIFFSESIIKTFPSYVLLFLRHLKEKD